MAAPPEETLMARCEIPIIDLAHIGESESTLPYTTYNTTPTLDQLKCIP